jgi:hypothetical protein
MEGTVPLPGRSVNEIEAELTELAAHIHAATYRMLELIRELDEQYPWADSGWRSTAHYLSWRIGLDPGAAREKVRVARALPALPRIGDCLRRGELSYSKVRALTRIATPDNEQDLLDIARAGTAAHVEKVVRAYRGVERTAELETAAAQHEARFVNSRLAEDGSLVLNGQLPPEEGARFRKALEAFENALRAEEPTDSDAPAHSERSWGQRSADALVRMAETAVAAGDVASDAARCQVVVHVDAQVLAEPAAAGRSEVEQAGSVPAETSRRLACDADVIPMTDGPRGEPLDIGRKSRVIPAGLRRALRARDEGCAFPGCNATRFVEGHHIRHWAEGGPTKLDNLVQLCGFHHRAVHEGGVKVSMQPGGEPAFSCATHGKLEESPPLPAVGDQPCENLARQHEGLGLAMTPETGLPSWEGEMLDLDYIIWLLFQDRPANDQSVGYVGGGRAAGASAAASL